MKTDNFDLKKSANHRRAKSTFHGVAPKVKQTLNATFTYQGTGNNCKPSIQFTLQGRSTKKMVEDDKRNNYYDKKHEKHMNNISELVDRKDTLKKRGILTPYDKDIKQFESINEK